jgi:hypothetical protein
MIAFCEQNICKIFDKVFFELGAKYFIIINIMSELALGRQTEEAAVLDSKSKHSLRRLLGVTALVVAAEAVTPHLIRPWGKTIIRPFAEGGEHSTAADVIAFAGLGHRNALSVAKDIRPLFPGHSLFYVKYANQGINPESIGQALAAHYQARGYREGDERGQVIVAHSMGHPTVLHGFKWCIDNGVYVPHVDKLVGISTPCGLADTSKQKQVDILLGSHYLGGTLSKMLIEGVQHYMDHDEDGRRKHSKSEAVWHGVKAGFTSYHPWHYIRQLHLLKQSDSGFEPGTFEGIFTSRTEVNIFDSELDTTVLRQLAANSNRELFEPYEITPTFITVPGMPHGGVAEAVAHCLKGEMGFAAA